MDASMVPPDVAVADKTTPMQQLSEEDIDNMTFETHEEAFQFYSHYAYVIGFSVRRDTLHKDKETGIIQDRVFSCSCAGFKKQDNSEVPRKQREHSGLPRCGCLAKLRVKFDRVNSRYVVAGFVKDHNHPLVPKYDISQLHSHRHPDDVNRDEAHSLRSVGINPSRIMDLFTHEGDGNHSVVFPKNDLYKVINHDRQVEFSTGDAKVVLAYLFGKSDSDPMFFFQHTFDDDNQLDKLFWTDGRSRAEFAVFGDVLIFDTTYKTNSYKFPLIILAGANNHLKTCIFGAALVRNDSIDSYIWVLKTFMNAMNHKRPLSVVIDGEESLQAAISEVFPDARRRLCKWHLLQDADANVNIKDFSHIFSRFMSLDCSIDEFEDGWRKMVVQYGLENDKWIAEVYERRHMWAKAYLRGHFFGSVKSTRCCESMNAFLNGFVESDRELIDVVRNYHRGLECNRNVVNPEVRAHHTAAVLTSVLTDLERHASKVYTGEVFMKIQKQINLQTTLWHQQVIPHFDGSRTYIITDYNTDSLSRHVLFRKEGLDLACDCKMFESSGMPCKHMIYVLKCEGVNEIPPSCINERWTTEISKDLHDKNLISATTDEVDIAQHGYIVSKCNEMGFYAKQTSQGYREVITGVANLTARAKELWMMQVNTSFEADSSQPIEFDICWIPRVPKPKGESQKKMSTKALS